MNGSAVIGTIMMSESDRRKMVVLLELVELKCVNLKRDEAPSQLVEFACDSTLWINLLGFVVMQARVTF